MPSFGWRVDARSAYAMAKVIVQPASSTYKPRGIGGMFDSGAMISCFTLQEQPVLKVKDSETIPCTSRVADNSKVVGKLVVLTAHLEGDDGNPFRLPIIFLPQAQQVLIGLAGILNHYDIHHDPANWRTDFTWAGPQPPPKGMPAGAPWPNPRWAAFWEEKVTEQLAVGRSWTDWEAAGSPDDWLAHWDK